MTDNLQVIVKAAGLDKPSRMIYGYMIVTHVAKSAGLEPYRDTQGHWVSPEVATAAALDFAKNSMAVNDQHEGADVGRSYFVFPMTEAIAKSLSLGWTADAEARGHGPGVLVGAQLSAEEFALVETGERAGFSIEGEAQHVPASEAA